MPHEVQIKISPTRATMLLHNADDGGRVAPEVARVLSRAQLLGALEGTLGPKQLIREGVEVTRADA